ncbi:MAG: C-GCAxxG-C-C family (seleno)protein [Thermoleophilia bacterium]
MSDKVMSRRKFLAGAGAVVGVATVAGVGLAGRPSDAEALGTAIPWPYPTDPSLQPVAETLARRAYEVYYASGCAEATWWPVIEFLAADNPTTWGTLPKNVMRYGGGGCGGWGTLCGTLNGSSAIISMCVADGAARGKMIDEAMQYYGETPLPTNGIDKAVRAGWAPAAGVVAPLVNVPTSTAHSQLCHASLSQWTMTTGERDGSVAQKDRCGKACHDLVLKVTGMLNAYFLNNTNVPAGTLDETIGTCGPCHQPAKGKMACDSCHDESPDHSFGD